MARDLAITAKAMRDSLAMPDRGRGESEALRLALSFIEVYDKADTTARAALLDSRPEPTGDRRFDALLAAVAEHLCAMVDVTAPAWASAEDRFLDQWWFVAGLRSLEADALVHSPISFSRRGIFITADALSYA